ncbi:MAG: hypothetical protein AAFV98_14075 [Chloroflexota bacterium]
MIQLLPHILNDDDISLEKPIPGSHIARILPDILQPIRREIIGLFGARVDDYRVAFWLSCVAVGLNFARKRTSSVSKYDNLFGLMYASVALKNILEHFGVHIIEEEVPSISWMNR